MSFGASARALRRQALSLLQTASDGDAVATFQIVSSGDARIMSGVDIVGDPVLVRLLRACEGRAPSGSAADEARATLGARRRSWRLEAPRAQSLNHFVDSATEYAVPMERLEHTDVMQRWRRPGRIAQEVRMLAYDGRHFVGWLGALRCGRRPFTEEQRARMARLAPRARSLLAQAHQLERLDGEAHLVLDVDGRVDGVTERARPWLSAERASDLARAARAGLSQWLLDDVAVAFIPLLDGDRPRTLVHLRPRPGVTLASAGLSPKQLDLARLAAKGLTVAELASTLGLSPNTVKWHLKAVYAALDVRSRVELARAIED